VNNRVSFGFSVKRGIFFAAVFVLFTGANLSAQMQLLDLFGGGRGGGQSYTNVKLSLSVDRDSYGPFFYRQTNEMGITWGVPPLMSHGFDEVTDFDEWDFLYPFVTLDRFGEEYRFQIIQLFSFSGGDTQSDTNVHRFTLFPFYFQQRSKIPGLNYTALLPLGGRIKGRFFRDDIQFALFPIWAKTRKREVVTENYVYPVFHLRHGPGLKGWQFWPLYGQEHKEITYRTNIWDEVDTVPGHDQKFVLWPIYLNATTGIGTTNEVKQRAVLPLFSLTRSPNRDSSTYFWPFGYTRTVDREKKYTETDVPWPIIVFARGEKYTTRVWPLFSHAHDATKESDFYLWPVYKFNRIHSDPLDRTRMRILFFLYSDIKEQNTETGRSFRRKDFWPLFTSRTDFEGNHRLQILSILEPVLPNSKSIERNYSPLWSLWRSERTEHGEAVDQSLLWDLYRRRVTPESKKISLLFGLFKYQSTPNGKPWRVLGMPLGKTKTDERAAGEAK
jgi:hypothetical protein